MPLALLRSDQGRQVRLRRLVPAEPRPRSVRRPDPARTARPGVHQGPGPAATATASSSTTTTSFPSAPAPPSATQILRDVKKVMADCGIKATMATTNLFYHPVFKDGAFTSTDPAIRAYATQKVMNAIDVAADLGAQVFVFWGGREGVEVDASKDPVEATKWFREAINFLCNYVLSQRLRHQVQHRAEAERAARRPVPADGRQRAWRSSPRSIIRRCAASTRRRPTSRWPA